MKIEIKGLKIAQFASEETICFSASVYADGKKFAEASNHGQGGSTDIHSTNKELYDKVVAYCKTLPPIVSQSLSDPNDPTKSFSYEQDLEAIVDGLVHDADRAKEMTRIEKRLLKEDVDNTFFRLEGDAENQLLCYRTVKAKGQRATEYLDKKFGKKYRLVPLSELLEETKKAVHA